MSGSSTISWAENGFGPFSRPSSKSSFIHRKKRVNLQDYFVGPRDITRHSKWPRALRMHGSVTPKILVRTICLGVWATLITVISMKVYPINVHPIITTALSILVGLALNLRSSTAYERYMDGRKVWSRLSGVSSALARNMWIEVDEREGEQGKEDLLGKLSFLNLIVAFAIALKHKCRFEPYVQYEDLHDLVSHLDTFARDAGGPSEEKKRNSTITHIENLLRIAGQNPRRELKRAKKPLGNLPVEILSYMSSYIHMVVESEQIKTGSFITAIMINMEALTDIVTTADRILNTPLPVAYTIAISQITWIYMITFPFQLVHLMGWLTIPTTLVSAYIILGFAAIGNEIENPFGKEVSDLPLESYCAQIASDIAVISSRPPPGMHDFILHPHNKPLYPISNAELKYWPEMTVDDIRRALKTRAALNKPAMWRRQSIALGIHEETIEYTEKTAAHSVSGSTLHEKIGDRHVDRDEGCSKPKAAAQICDE